MTERIREWEDPDLENAIEFLDEWYRTEEQNNDD